MRTLLAAATTVIALTCLVGIAAGAAAGPTYVLGDCQHGTARPSKILVACGDGNYYVDHLKWSSWGKSIATARGVLHTNGCKPDCAHGRFSAHSARVRLYGRRICKGHPHPYYTQIRVTTAAGSSPTSLLCPQ